MTDLMNIIKERVKNLEVFLILELASTAWRTNQIIREDIKLKKEDAEAIVESWKDQRGKEEESKHMGTLDGWTSYQYKILKIKNNEVY